MASASQNRLFLPRRQAESIQRWNESMKTGMSRDPRIDAYIARQAEFARPILEELRETVHSACPEMEEGIKWGMPAFLLHGQILAHMAAFKAHAAFGFRGGSEVIGEARSSGEAMGQFGRLTSPADLPPRDELERLIRKAAAAVEAGPPRGRQAKPEPGVPDDLRAALAAEPAAAATFEAFPPSARRDYADWVAQAKRPETRARRIAQTVEWLGEGKRRNWKYEKR